MSVLTEAADMNVVIDELLKRSDIDAENLFLMGESKGGFVATYVAAGRPDDIRGLIALYPAYVIQDDAWKRTPDPNNIPEKMTLMGMEIERIYNADAMSFDIYDVMGNYTKPVLIIHGTADTLVPIEYSERAADAFSSSRLIKIEDAGHGFHGGDFARAAELSVDFVKENET